MTSKSRDRRGQTFDLPEGSGTPPVSKYHSQVWQAEARVEEAEFVRWWGETVSIREKLGRRANDPSAGQRQVSQKDAEQLSGITHQQVSKWRRRLKDPEKYRAFLFGVAYQKAMAMEVRLSDKVGKRDVF